MSVIELVRHHMKKFVIYASKVLGLSATPERFDDGDHRIESLALP